MPPLSFFNTFIIHQKIPHCTSQNKIRAAFHKKVIPQVIPPLYTSYPQKLSTYPQAPSLFCVRTYILHNIYDSRISLSTAYPQVKLSPNYSKLKLHQTVEPLLLQSISRIKSLCKVIFLVTYPAYKK